MISKSLKNIFIDRNFFTVKNILTLIYGFSIFLLCMPYFMWHTGNLKLYIFLLVGSISFAFIRKIKRYDLVLVPLFIYIFLYASIGNNILGIIYKLLMLSFIIIREDIIIQTLKWFKIFFCISLVLSLVTYFLIIFFSIPIDYKYIDPLNIFKTGEYVLYPFLVSNTLIKLDIFSLRFFGIFDEPGLIGSFATMLLFVDNYNFKSKQNIVLFIAGIFSFSLYFIISTLFYFLFTLSNVKRLLIFSGLLVFFTFSQHNDIANTLLWDRFTIVDGGLQGDNRSSATLDFIYTKFIHSSDFLWGKGSGYLREIGVIGNASYKELVIAHGAVFFILFCFSFTLFAYIVIKKPKFIIIFLFLFFGMLYQRPFIFDPAYFFLLVASVYAIKRISLNEDECNDLKNLDRN